MTILLATFGRLEVKVIVPVNPESKIISLILTSALAVVIAQRKVPEVPSSASEVTVAVVCAQDAEKHKRTITKVKTVVFFILFGN